MTERINITQLLEREPPDSIEGATQRLELIAFATTQAYADYDKAQRDMQSTMEFTGGLGNPFVGAYHRDMNATKQLIDKLHDLCHSTVDHKIIMRERTRRKHKSRKWYLCWHRKSYGYVDEHRGICVGEVTARTKEEAIERLPDDMSFVAQVLYCNDVAHRALNDELRSELLHGDFCDSAEEAYFGGGQYNDPKNEPREL